ncbi:MAG: hypothetical protein K6T73_11510 [Candidatus Bathyarchaeota archaeon]|nr:hypothetical protein [Candidatus Bathyarchaeota archaeon]
MAEEARRKRCEVLADIDAVLGDLADEMEYIADKEKAKFLRAIQEVIWELREMCRIE